MSHDDGTERPSTQDLPKQDVQKREHPRDSWLDKLRQTLGLKPAGSIRDDLEDALEDQAGGIAAEFSDEEQRILRNLLAARDMRVQDVMVARGAIIGLSETLPFREMRALFASAGHSRLPVYGETLDDAKGMIHIRDMFARIADIPDETPVAQTGLIRPVLFAPGSMPALDLLLDMQRKRIHMALVIDEYGGTDGLVSLEDLIEIIVGDIEDEHDIADNPEVETLPDGAIAINAQAPLEEVSHLLGVPVEHESEDHDVDTIGGYVAALFGRLPAPGEMITAPNGLSFTILAGDRRRIFRVRIDLPAPEADA